jgi:hypothetical protein
MTFIYVWVDEWVQATVPDHYAMAELSVAVNQGTLSLLQDETRPVGRLILDVSMQVHTPHRLPAAYYINIYVYNYIYIYIYIYISRELHILGRLG